MPASFHNSTATAMARDRPRRPLRPWRRPWSQAKEDVIGSKWRVQGPFFASMGTSDPRISTGLHRLKTGAERKRQRERHQARSAAAKASHVPEASPSARLLAVQYTSRAWLTLLACTMIVYHVPLPYHCVHECGWKSDR